MSSDPTARFEYFEQPCRFCRKPVPPLRGVFTAFLKARQYGCFVCLSPVCSSCGQAYQIHTDEGHGCPVVLCPECRDRYPELANSVAIQTATFRPRFCMDCGAVTAEETVLCSCCRNVSLCRKCVDRNAINQTTFCTYCAGRVREEMNTCPRCGQTEYGYFTKGSYFKLCQGCKKRFCVKCCNVLGKIGDRIDRLCPECGPKFPYQNSSDQQPGTSDGVIGKLSIWFKGLIQKK